MKVTKVEVTSIPKIEKNSVVAIGMFDSIHIYHKLIIEKVVNIGNSKNLNKILITFSNKPNSNFPNIISEAKKIKYIKKNFDIDLFIVIKTNHKLINTSRRKFVKILKRNLKCKVLVEGNDFKFGKNRKGNITYLNKCFGQENVYIFERKNDVSSSRIREMIDKNDLKELEQIMDIELLNND